MAVVEEGVAVGKRTRIWAFAHVLKGVTLGEDCNVCDHTFIEGRVRIGNRVTIKCGVSLWDGVVVEDDVFIGPNVVFTNDKRPRSRKRPPEYPETVLKQGCSLGANATILPGLTVGRWAMVGAGAVVTRDVPDFALVIGTPAKRIGWVCVCGEDLPALGPQAVTCSCERQYEQVSENVVRELSSSVSGSPANTSSIKGAKAT
jgi:UDP-2-acetamido-3-amino-2,3-dideoxy-glucuronate N-acetyltransferase